MNKKILLDTIKEAIAAHQLWASHAHALIEGEPLDRGQVPINPTHCQFGQWYYGSGQSLNHLVSFRDIEALHNDLHASYAQIFELLFGDEAQTPSFFERIMGQAHDNAANREKAKEKYALLEQQSERLGKKLDELEKLVDAMSESQLEHFLKA